MNIVGAPFFSVHVGKMFFWGSHFDSHHTYILYFSLSYHYTTCILRSHSSFLLASYIRNIALLWYDIDLMIHLHSLRVPCARNVRPQTIHSSQV
jgi:hypothetical protein